MNVERSLKAQHAMRPCGEHGAERLDALCRASGLAQSAGTLTDLFHWLVEPWGGRTLAELRQEWTSEVADDHTPYEFSVVYGPRGPQVRLLVEAHGQPAGLKSNWEAGLQLSRRIAQRFGVPLERHDAIADLFEPHEGAMLGIWHAVCALPGRPPMFKVYFDSKARGPGKAAALTEEALHRLGFERAWPAVRRVGRRGSNLAELRFFSLDLEPSDVARVKVYWRHHHATAQELGSLTEEGNAPPQRIEEFCRAMGGHKGPYSNRAVFTCSTLVDPEATRPASTTLYFPVVAYTASDAMAAQRIEGYMRTVGMDSGHYRASLEPYAARDLNETASLHSYVALRGRRGDPEVTVYFTPESEGPMPAEQPKISTPSPSSVRPATEIVRQYEEDSVLSDHPFLRRLAREPVSLSHLWLVIANFWEGVVSHFPTRLSMAIANMEDDRVRCLFAKQLNDELGEGDYANAHKPMFRELRDELANYRLEGDDARLLAPGRRLSDDLFRHLSSKDWHEAVGALMMVEIYGKQVDLLLGDQFRRQSDLPDEKLRWMHLHEELEVDHADDSLEVAKLMPLPTEGPEAQKVVESVWRGADGVVDASMAYFDRLYELCYE